MTKARVRGDSTAWSDRRDYSALLHHYVLNCASEYHAPAPGARGAPFAPSRFIPARARNATRAPQDLQRRCYAIALQEPATSLMDVARISPISPFILLASRVPEAVEPVPVPVVPVVRSEFFSTRPVASTRLFTIGRSFHHRAQ